MTGCYSPYSYSTCVPFLFVVNHVKVSGAFLMHCAPSNIRSLEIDLQLCVRPISVFQSDFMLSLTEPPVAAALTVHCSHL